MRKSLLGLVIVLLPACATAQVSSAPPAAAPVRGATAPKGPDTPVSTIPGASPTVAPAPVPSNDTPIPAVDSSGANRSATESTTGEAKAPIGAPRLPGEPANPPTGPDE